MIRWTKGILRYRRSLDVKRGGEMYPEYYQGVHGYEYRIEDRLGMKEAAESRE
ncbi:hypothetical protein [Paenibacillus radicis (ex Xue et al. 2023)]|uniref:Uncharacterized protein n=1 Tax=Paenibacillus radicis (ex Xue et al. 2023) TaxID=2972489 RepID=A0ABT1YDC9_9BACL|nr:hypothetical protein [Paenibacillus radicis (ex Xue et al. 2023)]MCR8631192.1 hypothetical protein [Paenibacillus radicis (ex Xue et al. 2023)]